MTNKPDKGKKDGSCNVTACQAPLAGTMQGWMRDHTVQNGRFYYCERCCRRFNEYDDSIREQRRITWDETTGPRVAGVHEDQPCSDHPHAGQFYDCDRAKVEEARRHERPLAQASAEQERARFIRRPGGAPPYEKPKSDSLKRLLRK